MILTLPGCVCRIWRCNTSDGDGEWWWSMSVINEVMKIITFKKRLDLKAPCEIIGEWQFDDIGKINYKEGMLRILEVLDSDRIVGGREGCIRSHWGEGKKKEENTPKKIRLLIPCWSREIIIEKQWLNFSID